MLERLGYDAHVVLEYLEDVQMLRDEFGDTVYPDI